MVNMSKILSCSSPFLNNSTIPFFTLTLWCNGRQNFVTSNYNLVTPNQLNPTSSCSSNLWSPPLCSHCCEIILKEVHPAGHWLLVEWNSDPDRANQIEHFFCDIPPILKLACGDTSVHELSAQAVSMLFAVVPFMLILVSYSKIISTILRLPTATGRGCPKFLVALF
jgi:hypothetical protein